MNTVMDENLQEQLIYLREMVDQQSAEIVKLRKELARARNALMQIDQIGYEWKTKRA